MPKSDFNKNTSGRLLSKVTVKVNGPSNSEL